MKQIRFTKEGLAKTKQEYEDLLEQRPAVVEDLKTAREMGDLSENGYYKASKAKLSFIDSRLFRIKTELKLAIIVEDGDEHTVSIGKTITLSDGEKEVIYTIVGDLEADPSHGKISLLSPLGRVLEGKNKGEAIYVDLPKGKVTYKIINIT